MPRLANRASRNIGMLEEHRQIITNNYEMLVTECDIQKLIPLFLEKKIFSPEMIRYHTGSSDIETKRNIFNSITKRGPKAFDNFIQCLHETNQHNIANRMSNNGNNYNSMNSSHGTHENRDRPRHAVPCAFPPYVESNISNIPNLNHMDANIYLSTTPLTVKVRKADRFYDGDLDQVYQSHSRHRGSVLIINNRNIEMEKLRKGAEYDDRNLKHLFEQMGFVVHVHTDLSKSEIEAAVCDFAQSPKLLHMDMIFVFIMSHGRNTASGSVVLSSDNKEVEINWIEQQFDNRNCINMQRKPKILVFQTCRGEMPDYGTLPMNKRIETDNVSMQIRSLSDTLVAHSTLSGYSSHRDIYLGSWYIQLICEVFMEYAHNTHIEDMLKHVDRKLESYRSEKMTIQTSTFTNKGFNKRCYLHPGIFLEDGIMKKFT